MPIMVIRGNKLITNETSSQYYGDKIPGELDSWDALADDPNKFLLDSYGVLSQRNSTLYQTEPVARACINKPLTYAIGDGVVFKSAVNADTVGWTKEQTTDWSKRLSLLLHLEKLAGGWYGKQSILFREASITGDSILYFLREDDNELPIEFIPVGGQAIDWEHTDKARQIPGWMLGIKMDQFGRETHFWQKSTDKEFAFKDDVGNINAIHFMFQELAQQARGYGMLQSVISLMKKMGKVWDATIARMVLESIMLGYYNVDTTDVAKQIKNFAGRANGKSTLTNDSSGSASSFEKSDNVQPGTMMQLKNKESMTFNDLKTPSDNFGMANELYIRLMSQARGYPPEFIEGRYNTSFTAHKGALNDAVKKFTQERKVFTDNVEKKVNLELLKHLARTGQIEVPTAFWTDYKVREACLMGTYLGPVPGHINPLQEVNANVKAVENGFTDHEAVARNYGNDFHEFVDSWDEQQTRWLEGSAEHKATVMAAEEATKQAEAVAKVAAQTPDQEDSNNEDN